MYVCIDRNTVLLLERVVAVVTALPEEENGAGDGEARTTVVLDDGRLLRLKAGRETVVRKLAAAGTDNDGVKELG